MGHKIFNPCLSFNDYNHTARSTEVDIVRFFLYVWSFHTPAFKAYLQMLHGKVNARKLKSSSRFNFGKQCFVTSLKNTVHVYYIVI